VAAVIYLVESDMDKVVGELGESDVKLPGDADVGVQFVVHKSLTRITHRNQRLLNIDRTLTYFFPNNDIKGLVGLRGIGEVDGDSLDIDRLRSFKLHSKLACTLIDPCGIIC